MKIAIFIVDAPVFVAGDLADASEALASEVTETTSEKYGDIVEARGGKGLVVTMVTTVVKTC